jgi:hypothetical protein
VCHPLGAYLVGQPGVLRAALESPAESCQRRGGQDDADVCERAREDEAGAHDELGDDDGDPATVEVGDDPGGDLEDEVGDLERGARQHKLEGRHSHLADEVDRRHGPAERDGERLDALVEEPGPVGIETAHGVQPLSLIPTALACRDASRDARRA